MAEDTILIGNDHGGYELKQHIIGYLKEKGYSCLDMGSYSADISRYPYYASKVAGAISKGEYKRGILICSSGIGMSIMANKYPGIRASLCTSTYMGKITRAHNDSNILCLGGKITGVLEALDIVEAWLNTGYEGGRHDISLEMIREAEEAMNNGERWISEDPKVQKYQMPIQGR